MSIGPLETEISSEEEICVMQQHHLNNIKKGLKKR